MQTTSKGELLKKSEKFLSWLDEWLENRPELSIEDINKQAGGADGVGIICVDLTVGFAHKGALASPRVKGIVQPVVDLFTRAYGSGIRRFILPQDAHQPDSPEFLAWPAHCIQGTEEAETVPELKGLSFADQFKIVPKRSVCSEIGTSLEDELRQQPLKTVICVGDCTDICVYQLVLFLRASANASGSDLQVIVPADCVQTYDLPEEAALDVGALPHPGDLMHAVFLYHMALNGVRVVKSIA